MSDLPEVLLSAEQIQRRVAELGAEISRDLAGREPIVIGVLRGAFVFMADLIRTMDIPMRCDFLQAASYVGTAPAADPILLRQFQIPVAGETVLLIEDIVDSGATSQRVIELVKAEGPAEVRLCSLLRKPSAMGVSLDYLGFDVPEQFVVGYGLDHDGRWRNLPYVGVLGS